MQTHDDLIRQLDNLLDVERDALLKGDLEALSIIVEDKERLIAALNETDMATTEELVPMNDKVRRNHILLEQALNGIRSVSRKLAELRESRKAFDTYDRLGQKNKIRSQDTTTVEKRA